jgi:basic amino acid/polyamine antiporter, APA family
MSEPPGFRRQLGLFDATMLVAGTMIGSGIFLVSAFISRDVGAPGWLLLVWVLAGVMTVLGALTLAEMAGMMPHAGGLYVYLREAYGPLPAFLFGWTMFLVIQTGSIAAVAVAFGNFLGVWAPDLGPGNVLLRVPYHLPGLGPTMLEVSAGQFVAAGVIALLTLLNCRGVHEGKLVQNVFGVAKIGALLAVIVLGFTWSADPRAVAANNADWWGGIYHTQAYLAAASHPWIPPYPEVVIALVVGGAMVGALFSADAWSNVTFVAGEVRNPERNLARSMVLGTCLVIGLYLLVNLAYLASLPLHGTPDGATAFERGIDHAEQFRVGTALVERAFPVWGGRLMAAAILVSLFGCLNGLILMGARLYWAMARDGLFFRFAGELNDRGVPARGLALQGLWACALALSGSYDRLLNYVIFAGAGFYALTGFAVIVLRHTQPAAERPYRVSVYPLVPGLFVLASVSVGAALLIGKGTDTWPGLAIVLTGVPVYFLWRRRWRT